jgi:hypothetical protein
MMNGGRPCSQGGNVMASGLGGGTCVLFVKEQNYVFASCNFVPVDGVEYFSGICWREMYVFMFFNVFPENEPVDTASGPFCHYYIHYSGTI